MFLHSVFVCWVSQTQGFVRKVEVGVISYIDPAMQVITAGITHKATLMLLELKT